MNVYHSLVCMPCHNFQGPGKQEPGISQLLCWELALTLSMAYDMGIPPKMERASQIGQPKNREESATFPPGHIPRVEHSEFLLSFDFLPQLL